MNFFTITTSTSANQYNNAFPTKESYPSLEDAKQDFQPTVDATAKQYPLLSEVSKTWENKNYQAPDNTQLRVEILKWSLQDGDDTPTIEGAEMSSDIFYIEN